MGYDGLVSAFGAFSVQRQAAVDWRNVARDLPQSFTANGFPSADSGDRRAAAVQVQRLFDVVSSFVDRTGAADESSGDGSPVGPTSSSSPSNAAAAGVGITRFQFGSFLFLCDLLTTRRLKPVGSMRAHPVSARPATHQGVADRYEKLKIPLFMAAGGGGGAASFASMGGAGGGLSMLSHHHAPSMRRTSHQTQYSNGGGGGGGDIASIVQFHSDVVFDTRDVDAIFSYCSTGNRSRLTPDTFVIALAHVSYRVSRRATTVLAQLLQSFSFFVGEPFLAVHAAVHPFPEEHFLTSFDAARVLARFSKGLFAIFTHFISNSGAPNDTADGQHRMSFEGYVDFCAELGVESMVGSDVRRRIFEQCAREATEGLAVMRAELQQKAKAKRARMRRLRPISAGAANGDGAEDGDGQIPSVVTAADLYLNFDEFLEMLARMAAESTNTSAFSHLPTLSRRIEQLVLSLVGPLYTAIFERDLMNDLPSDRSIVETYDAPVIHGASPVVVAATNDALTLHGTGFGSYGRGVWVYASCVSGVLHLEAEELMAAATPSASAASGGGDGNPMAIDDAVFLESAAGALLERGAVMHDPRPWSALTIPVGACRGEDTQWHRSTVSLLKSTVSQFFADDDAAIVPLRDMPGPDAAPDQGVTATDMEATAVVKVHVAFAADIDVAVANSPEDLLLASKPQRAAVLEHRLQPFTLSRDTLDVLEGHFHEATTRSSRFNKRLAYFAGFQSLWRSKRLEVGSLNRTALLVTPSDAAVPAAVGRDTCLKHLFDQLARVRKSDTSAQPALKFADFVELLVRLTLTLPGISTATFEKALLAQLSAPSTGRSAAADGEAGEEFGSVSFLGQSAMRMPPPPLTDDASGVPGSPSSPTTRSGGPSSPNSNTKKEVLLRSAATHRRQNELLTDQVKALRAKLAELEKKDRITKSCAVRVAECFEGVAAVADVSISQLVAADLGRSEPHDALAQSLRQSVIAACEKGRGEMMKAVPEIGSTDGDRLLSEYRIREMSEASANAGPTNRTTTTSTIPAPSVRRKSSVAAAAVNNPVVDTSVLRSELRTAIADADGKVRDFQKRIDQERAAANAGKASEGTDQLSLLVAAERKAVSRCRELEDEVEQLEAAAVEKAAETAKKTAGIEGALQESRAECKGVRNQVEQLENALRVSQSKVSGADKRIQELTATITRMKRLADKQAADDDDVAGAPPPHSSTSLPMSLEQAQAKRKHEEEVKSLKLHVTRLTTQSSSLQGEVAFLKQTLVEVKRRRAAAESEATMLRRQLSQGGGGDSTGGARDSPRSPTPMDTAAFASTVGPGQATFLTVGEDGEPNMRSSSRASSTGGGGGGSSYRRRTSSSVMRDWFKDAGVQTDVDPDSIGNLLREFDAAREPPTPQKGACATTPLKSPPRAGSGSPATTVMRRRVRLRAMGMAAKGLKEDLAILRNVISKASSGFTADTDALRSTLRSVRMTQVGGAGARGRRPSESSLASRRMSSSTRTQKQDSGAATTALGSSTNRRPSAAAATAANTTKAKRSNSGTNMGTGGEVTFAASGSDDEARERQEEPSDRVGGPDDADDAKGAARDEPAGGGAAVLPPVSTPKVVASVNLSELPGQHSSGQGEQVAAPKAGGPKSNGPSRRQSRSSIVADIISAPLSPASAAPEEGAATTSAFDVHQILPQPRRRGSSPPNPPGAQAAPPVGSHASASVPPPLLSSHAHAHAAFSPRRASGTPPRRPGSSGPVGPPPPPPPPAAAEDPVVTGEPALRQTPVATLIPTAVPRPPSGPSSHATTPPPALSPSEGDLLDGAADPVMSVLGLGGHAVRPTVFEVTATASTGVTATGEVSSGQFPMPFVDGVIPRTAGSLELVVMHSGAVAATAPDPAPRQSHHQPRNPATATATDSASQRALRLQLAQIEGRRAASGSQPAIPDRTTHPALVDGDDGGGHFTPRRRHSPDPASAALSMPLTARPPSSAVRPSAPSKARPSTGGVPPSASFKPTLPMPFALSESNKKHTASPFGPRVTTEDAIRDSDTATYDSVVAARVNDAPNALQSDGTTLLSQVGPLPPSMRPHAARQPALGPNTMLPRPSRLGANAAATPQNKARGRRGQHELAKYAEAAHRVEVPHALRSASAKTARRPM